MPRHMTMVRMAFAALACSMAVASAAAHSVKPRVRHSVRPVPPSMDAVELAGVAPPASHSTALQTYGDAAVARTRFQQRYPAEERADAVEAATVGVPYPCEPLKAGADAYLCRNDPHPVGYGQGYAFTPSYVSSPQVVGVDPSEQSPVLPGVTGIAWAINALRFDPH